MISQHPDHASKPYWLEEEFIGTHNESKECFLSFSELGSSEYKWDWEGKLVDESVMERLMSSKKIPKRVGEMACPGLFTSTVIFASSFPFD